MTTTLAQGVDRRPSEPVRPLGVLALSPALVVLLLAGLALRLTIAYVLFPASGFESDLALYASWAATMAEHGPAGFYANAGFSDYPPAYLYLLWLVGKLAPAGGAGDLVKIPPMVLDLAVGYAIYRLVRGWTWPGARGETLALAAAALYLFNPVSFYDSALWGQSDAAGALVLLLGVAALIRGNSEGAAALAAAAALVKPQFGVVLIPLVLFVLLRRHLVRPGSGPRRRPWAPAGLAALLTREQGWPRLLTALAAAWAAFFVMALPFGMGPVEYLERMFGTAGQYGYLTVNAYNLWALLGAGGAPSLAERIQLERGHPAAAGAGPGSGHRRRPARGRLRSGAACGQPSADDRWTIIVAATLLATAFFVLPTRVHERYIFPVFALMPLLAVVQRRWAIALLLLSVGAFINLHGVLTLPLYGSANVETLVAGEWFRTAPLIMLSALLQTGVGLWVAWQLRPSLGTSPDGFDRQAGLAVPRQAASLAAAPGAPAPGAPAPPHAPPTGYPPAPAAAHSAGGGGRVDRLVARLSWGSLRRDRSATLASEPGGRIDRKDLLVLVVLVVVTLLVRGARLEQPTHMYFDEVYHARTATEFLQHWEYGEAHDIYEFTHPHLAKYAMAWGIRLAGGNEVTGSIELGVPVSDALLEPRWSPSDDQRQRNGDRLYVATGDSVRAYDRADDQLVAELPLAASVLALDAEARMLFMADASGGLYRLDTTSLDALRRAETGSVPIPPRFADGPGAPVDHLLVTDSSVVAVTRGGISTFDTETGALLAERLSVAVTDVIELPWAERLLIDTRAVADRAGAADVIAAALAGDALADVEPAERARISRLLATDRFVVLAAYLDETVADILEAAIDSGDLPGATLERGPLLAVADAAGITLLDAWTLDPIDEIPSHEPVTGLVLADPDGNEPTLYGASGAELISIPLSDDGPGPDGSVWMPGPVERLAWNGSAELVHVLGDAPDGGPTVYVVEPKGRSVFIDVPLPDHPAKLLADAQPQRPEADRSELLAITGEGDMTTVGIGGNAFGWRVPGMLIGVLGAALLYLLARALFARRSVGLIVAALVVAEGMLFANSRIAMNDAYVTTFVVLAVLLLTPLYLARRRAWTALLILLGVGVALGLALASKWVALYAIGGMGLLVLFRSGLGRLVALTGMIGLTAVLGGMSIRGGPTDDPARNWAFLMLMVLLTALLTAGMVRRPIPLTRAEALLAVAMPLAAGAALVLVERTLAGGLAVTAGLAIGAVLVIAGRLGRGPFAPGAPQPPPGTSAWLRPGPRQVVPWLITLAALTIVPLLVYILSYAPWVDLGNDWGLPLLGSLPGLPASTDGGQTLLGLTESMYQYHDNLRAEHAASSPWWAWPLDLKPVWFFQERYSGNLTGLIYDSGNLVIFWMGIAGLAFSAWAAWRRRSLALTVVVIMWAAMWLPWARIDRAAFQYHVYASLPFMLLALSYFLAELWHGPAARTWFLARAAAAIAILGAPLLWLLRTPLCILSGTAVANPSGLACASGVTRTAQLSEGGVVALVVFAVGVGAAAFLVWRASRPALDGDDLAGHRRFPVVAMVLVVAITLGGVIAALLLLDTSSTTSLALSSDLLAVLALAVLAAPAWLTLRSRDPRRFVLGVLAAALVWLVAWYPNSAGLPLPSDLAEHLPGPAAHLELGLPVRRQHRCRRRGWQRRCAHRPDRRTHPHRGRCRRGRGPLVGQARPRRRRSCRAPALKSATRPTRPAAAALSCHLLGAQPAGPPVTLRPPRPHRPERSPRTERTRARGTLGSLGISAEKPEGSWSAAASRRMTKP